MHSSTPRAWRRVWCQFRDLWRSIFTVVSLAVLFPPLALAAMNGSLQARCLLFPLHVLHSLCHTLLRVMDGSREFAVQSGHGVEIHLLQIYR